MQSLGQGIEVMGTPGDQGETLSPNPSWAGGFPCKAWVAPEPVYPPKVPELPLSIPKPSPSEVEQPKPPPALCSFLLLFRFVQG